MAADMRIKTSIRDGLTTVRAIIIHPMDTGNSRDLATGDIIPAYFIETVTIEHIDKVIMTCDWSRAVSKNPYLAFSFYGAKPGDIIRISWIDTSGISQSKTAKIRA